VIGLDTNILVRYIVRDDARQTSAATRLIESTCTADSPGAVALITLCELVWVLDRGYRYRRGQIAAVVRRILAAEELHVERSELAWRALRFYEEGKADFADYLIGLCGRDEGAEATFTLDRRTAGCELFRQLAV
jgi:predicted nucleic-acid-binding protein